ncbi:MAG: hypothetical protein M1827_001206 [Pycnora praestabilis]|nr:MAG: hypothetical protein M1827_001206 [Pycnora praestabilis]
MSNLTKQFAHDDSSSDEGSKHSAHSSGVKRKTSTRASRAGTRSVNTLTAAQLERKRANDREAQRAIRQRTKDHIDKLERRIAELSADHDASEKLSTALQRNEMLEIEVAKLRTRLQGAAAPAMGYARDPEVVMRDAGMPIPHRIPSDPTLENMKGSPTAMSATSLANIPPISTAPSQVAFSDPWQQTPFNNVPRSSISASSVSSGEYSTDVAPWGPEDVTTSTAMTDGSAQAYDPSIPPSLNFNFLLDGNNQPVTFIGTSGGRPNAADAKKNENQMPIIAENPFISTPAVTTEGIPILPRNSAPESVAGFPPPPFVHQPSIYSFEIPIRNMAPTCPVDSILLGFLQQQRSLAINSEISESALIGPKYPSVSSLLNPEAALKSHPVSKVLTDILCSLPDLNSVPERVAVLFILYVLMRWQISPSPLTYDALPDFMTPRPSQLVTHHPIWMDQVAWPDLRDRIINHQDIYDTLEFQALFTAHITVNWPYRPMDALVFQNDEVLMNPVFERHINRLDNWSMGPGFAQRYPELADVCKFSG